MPSEDLTNTIDRWDDAGRQLIEYIAKAKTFEVAVAACEAAVKSDPHSFIRMSHRARVLRERKPIPWKP
jgi:hypothetical protein